MELLLHVQEANNTLLTSKTRLCAAETAEGRPLQLPITGKQISFESPDLIFEKNVAFAVKTFK